MAILDEQRAARAAEWGDDGLRRPLWLWRRARAASGSWQPGWYWLPWPLAFLIAFAMPWRAVRHARKEERVVQDLLDILMITIDQLEAERAEWHGTEAPEPLYDRVK